MTLNEITKYCKECDLLIENKDWYLKFGKNEPKKDQQIPNYCPWCGNKLVILSPYQSKLLLSQKRVLTEKDQDIYYNCPICGWDLDYMATAESFFLYPTCDFCGNTIKKTYFDKNQNSSPLSIKVGGVLRDLDIGRFFRDSRLKHEEEGIFEVEDEVKLIEEIIADKKLDNEEEINLKKIIFCDECGAMIRPTKIDGKIVNKCRCHDS